MGTEVYGDATRGDAWAAVRLEVEGETIVAADAPGLDRALVGLALLAAASGRGGRRAARRGGARIRAWGGVRRCASTWTRGRRDERRRRQRRGAPPRRPRRT